MSLAGSSAERSEPPAGGGRFYSSSSSSAFDRSAAPTVLNGSTLDDDLGSWGKSASFNNSGRRTSALFGSSQKFSTSAPAGGSSVEELDEELQDARENLQAMESCSCFRRRRRQRPPARR